MAFPTLSFFFSFSKNRYYHPSTIDAPLDWCLRSSGSPLFPRKSIASISLRTHHDEPLHFPFGNWYFCTLAEHTEYPDGYIAVIFHLLIFFLFSSCCGRSLKNILVEIAKYHLEFHVTSNIQLYTHDQWDVCSRSFGIFGRLIIVHWSLLDTYGA